MIFFQGAEDPIVLPNQSRLMHDSLKRRGIATALIEFPGEKHGFRKPASITRALEAELYFYRRVLHLPTPGSAPVAIDNLAEQRPGP